MADNPFDQPVIVSTGDPEKDEFISDLFERAGMSSERLRAWMEEVKRHAIAKGSFKELTEEEFAAEQGLTVEQYRQQMADAMKRIEHLLPKMN
jgi:hypothetical protein